MDNSPPLPRPSVDPLPGGTPSPGTLRLPHPEQRLAGCCWLPRLTAKTRVYLAGDMPRLYLLSFGSRLGVDGYFLRNFGLRLGDVIRAVKRSSSDGEVVAWFLAQPGVTPVTIDRWNALAVRLGSKGNPGYWTLRLVRRRFYPQSVIRPVGSMFEAIVQDEGLGPL